MAHIPVEPDPVAVAAIAPAELEPAPASTAKVSCLNVFTLTPSLSLVILLLKRHLS